MKNEFHRSLAHGRCHSAERTVRRREFRLIRHGLLVTVAIATLAWPGSATATPRRDNTSGPVRFAVVSDPHTYNTKLGTSGAAYDNYLVTDLKMLHLSEPILDAVVADILSQDVRFAIFSGDLSKDGEVLNHVDLAKHLQDLRQAGVAVYVVPGNHDINNPDAVEYRKDGTKPVPSVSPATFRALYERFGYGQALDRAPDSLSYLAEPVAGLWLLALDSAKWAENATAPHPLVSGRVSGATLAWALAKLQQAQAAGKRVIAFMHHGVNPHFLSQPMLFPEYLVDNWPAVGAQLATAGLRVVFTGHFHAQDAVTTPPGGATLVDIETGSILSYPCAYRVAELDGGGVLHVASRRITNIKADLGGVPFQQYAELFHRALLPYSVVAVLQQELGLPLAQAQAIAPWVVDAMMAHYAGDESPSPQTQALLAWLSGQPEPLPTLAALLSTLWYDLPPGDNTLAVPLN